MHRLWARGRNGQWVAMHEGTLIVCEAVGDRLALHFPSVETLVLPQNETPSGPSHVDMTAAGEDEDYRTVKG